MSKPDYVCTCVEMFDEYTGISYGIRECIPCEAWDGACHCSCRCGQCLYNTETPCGELSNEEPCKFCLQRLIWKEEDEARWKEEEDEAPTAAETANEEKDQATLTALPLKEDS